MNERILVSESKENFILSILLFTIVKSKRIEMTSNLKRPYALPSLNVGKIIQCETIQMDNKESKLKLTAAIFQSFFFLQCIFFSNSLFAFRLQLTYLMTLLM